MAKPRIEFKRPSGAPSVPAKALQETARLLGLKRVPRSDLELIDVTLKGFPGSALVALAASLDVPMATVIAQLDIPARTAARRLKPKATLTMAESERALRLARILARATEVFEDRAAARQWLGATSIPLGGRRPFDLLATDVGTEMVLTELGKIDHGFFA